MLVIYILLNICIVKNFLFLGKITLFTKIFGRGTDFKVHDEKVISNGGKFFIEDFIL